MPSEQPRLLIEHWRGWLAYNREVHNKETFKQPDTETGGLCAVCFEKPTLVRRMQSLAQSKKQQVAIAKVLINGMIIGLKLAGMAKA